MASKISFGSWTIAVGLFSCSNSSLSYHRLTASILIHSSLHEWISLTSSPMYITSFALRWFLTIILSIFFALFRIPQLSTSTSWKNLLLSRNALTVEILFVVIMQFIYVCESWLHISLSPGNVFISFWCFWIYFLILRTKKGTCRVRIHIFLTMLLILCVRNTSLLGIIFRWYFLAKRVADCITRSSVSHIVPSKSRKIALIIYLMYPFKNSFRSIAFFPSGLSESCSTDSFSVLFS